MKTKMIGLLCLCMLAGGSFLTSICAAEEYPARPIKMYVAFKPGGGTDVAARGIARYIQKYLGEDSKIAIINKPGAGGEIGFTTLATSKPDGYTIGFINVPAIIAYAIERKTKYQMSDFQPLGNIVYDPGVWVVKADSNIKNLQDVLDFAKASPGVLTIGTTGSSGSSEHVMIMEIERRTGTKFNHAPFGSTAPMRSALLGGHIPMGAMNLSECVTLEAEGEIRIIGTMSELRSEMVPHVPTFKEQGLDVISGSSRGLAAPKGMPPEIFNQLEEAVKKAVNDPEYVAQSKKSYVPLNYMTGQEYSDLINRFDQDLREIWKTSPWK